jgi:hypothetical protein
MKTAALGDFGCCNPNAWKQVTRRGLLERHHQRGVNGNDARTDLG